MKHNPRINEEIARIPGFAWSHPLQPDAQVQGNLELLWWLEEALKEILGMARVTLQPVAGAHGELTGILMVHKALAESGNARKYILIPDSGARNEPGLRELRRLCHQGTEVQLPRHPRPASARRSGYRGSRRALMITVPNTLGVFENQIIEIADILHRKGAYLYCDGANLNSFVGIARPGDMGIDCIHSNLHKTFSTPHGGGGSGGRTGRRLVETGAVSADSHSGTAAGRLVLSRSRPSAVPSGGSGDSTATSESWSEH